MYVLIVAVYHDDTDACGDIKDVFVPYQLGLPQPGLKPLGDLRGLTDACSRKQDTELVTPKTGREIAGTNHAFNDRGGF